MTTQPGEIEKVARTPFAVVVTKVRETQIQIDTGRKIRFRKDGNPNWLHGKSGIGCTGQDERHYLLQGEDGRSRKLHR